MSSNPLRRVNATVKLDNESQSRPPSATGSRPHPSGPRPPSGYPLKKVPNTLPHDTTTPTADNLELPSTSQNVTTTNTGSQNVTTYIYATPKNAIGQNPQNATGQNVTSQIATSQNPPSASQELQHPSKTDNNANTISTLPKPSPQPNKSEWIPKVPTFFQTIQVQAHLTKDDPKNEPRHSKDKGKPEEVKPRKSNASQGSGSDEEERLHHHHRYRHHHDHRHHSDPENRRGSHGAKDPSVTTEEITTMKDIINDVEEQHKKHHRGSKDEHGEKRHSHSSRRNSRKSKDEGVKDNEKSEQKPRHSKDKGEDGAESHSAKRHSRKSEDKGNPGDAEKSEHRHSKDKDEPHSSRRHSRKSEDKGNPEKSEHKHRHSSEDKGHAEGHSSRRQSRKSEDKGNPEHKHRHSEDKGHSSRRHSRKSEDKGTQADNEQTESKHRHSNEDKGPAEGHKTATPTPGEDKEKSEQKPRHSKEQDAGPSSRRHSKHRESHDGGVKDSTLPITDKGGPSVTTEEIIAMKEIINDVEDKHKQHHHNKDGHGEKRASGSSRRQSRKSTDLISISDLKPSDYDTSAATQKSGFDVDPSRLSSKRHSRKSTDLISIGALTKSDYEGVGGQSSKGPSRKSNEAISSTVTKKSENKSRHSQNESQIVQDVSTHAPTVTKEVSVKKLYDAKDKRGSKAQEPSKSQTIGAGPDGGPSVTTEEITAIRNIMNDVEEQHKKHRGSKDEDKSRKPRKSQEPDPGESTKDGKKGRKSDDAGQSKSQKNRKSQDKGQPDSRRHSKSKAGQEDHHHHKHHDEDTAPNFLIERYIKGSDNPDETTQTSKQVNKQESSKPGNQSQSGAKPPPSERKMSKAGTSKTSGRPPVEESSIRDNKISVAGTSMEKQEIEAIQTTNQDVSSDIFNRNGNPSSDPHDRKRSESKPRLQPDLNCNTITATDADGNVITRLRPRLPSFVFDPPPPPPLTPQQQHHQEKERRDKKKQDKSRKDHHKDHHSQNYQTFAVLTDVRNRESPKKEESTVTATPATTPKGKSSRSGSGSGRSKQPPTPSEGKVSPSKESSAKKTYSSSDSGMGATDSSKSKKNTATATQKFSSNSGYSDYTSTGGHRGSGSTIPEYSSQYKNYNASSYYGNSGSYTGSKKTGYSKTTMAEEHKEGESSQPMLSMTDKGAIRLQLPGRIQHKTTIKLTHFPDGSNDSVVINAPCDNPVPECDATTTPDTECDLKVAAALFGQIQQQQQQQQQLPGYQYGQHPSAGAYPQQGYQQYPAQQFPPPGVGYPPYVQGHGQIESYQQQMQQQSNPYAQYGQYGYPPC